MIRRDVIFCEDSNQLLQFLPFFKIHRCPDSFPKPPMSRGHHPYFIDYVTQEVSPKSAVLSYHYSLNKKPDFDESPKSPVPDFMAQSHENLKTKNTILFLINALTERYFFYYELSNLRQSWSISLDGEHKLGYTQAGYLTPEFERELSEIDPHVNYKFLDPTLLHFKDEEGWVKRTINLHELLGAYYLHEENNLKRDYLNACVVLTKAQELGSVDLSASYIFLVSALEALISIEYQNQEAEPCKCCGQPQYKVSRKFKDFIDKYGYEVSNKTKNDFYQMRSKISHFGELFGSSYQQKMFIESQEDFNDVHKSTLEHQAYVDFLRLVKTCFRTFLLFNFSMTTKVVEP